MCPGDDVEGYYLLKKVSSRVTSAGKPYLNMTLSDTSDFVEAKCWDYSGPIAEQDEGKIVKIRGNVSEFNGSNQITVERIRLADEKDLYEYNIADIIPTAPIDSVRELEYVQNLISTMTDEEYKLISQEMVEKHLEAFGNLPAAKSVHHSFVSGLLMHTANMLRIADFLATDIYPDTIDRNLLIAGTLLHDFAKEKEYLLSEYGLVTEQSTKGVLLGHLTMGSEEIGQVGKELGVSDEKIMLLQHMILSHHGQPEFGAAVKPCIAESELLSYIDMLDSRMEIYKENYDKMEDKTFSQKDIFSLGKRIYKH